MNGSIQNWFLSLFGGATWFSVASPIFGNGTMNMEVATILAVGFVAIGKLVLTMIDKNNEARHQEKNERIKILEGVVTEQKETIRELQDRNAEKSAIIETHITNHDTTKENEPCLHQSDDNQKNRNKTMTLQTENESCRLTNTHCQKT